MNRNVIVVGGSTGAVSAVRRLCADLPADLQASVLVVVHVGQQGEDLLASILDVDSALPVSTAQDGMTVEAGRVYVAPVGQHLLLLDSVIRLGVGPRENLTRPAIDPLFRSAAISHGPRVIGVVLTGMLNDGAAGLAAVKRCGGVTMVQNPTDAQASDMPSAALLASDVDYRCNLAEMASQLVRISRQEAGPPVLPQPDIVLEVDIALGRVSDSQALLRIADPAPLTCPSCHGVMSEVRGSSPLRFRCQVGHAMTAEILAQQQEDSSDHAMRMALRIIEERVTLAERMARDARASGRVLSAATLDERAREYRGHADTLREALLRHLRD